MHEPACLHACMHACEHARLRSAMHHGGVGCCTLLAIVHVLETSPRLKVWHPHALRLLMQEFQEQDLQLVTRRAAKQQEAAALETSLAEVDAQLAAASERLEECGASRSTLLSTLDRVLVESGSSRETLSRAFFRCDTPTCHGVLGFQGCDMP